MIELKMKDALIMMDSRGSLRMRRVAPEFIQLQCYDILTVSLGISGTYKRRGQPRTSGPTP